MMKTRIGTKMYFTIKLNLVNHLI